MTPSTAVVICAYTLDRWDDLVAAVASAQAQRPPPTEVVVVADSAPDLAARAADLPGARVVLHTGRRGLSGARNTGVQETTADVVAFLDDDAVARPGWLAGLVAHLADPAVAAVGGRGHPRFDDHRPRWLPEAFDWVIGCSHGGLPTDAAADVRNLVGCNMAFRRDALERAGGFDPALGRVGTVPVGCEETELCIRLREVPAARVVYEPAVGVDHRVRRERATVGYFTRRCWAEGRSKALVGQRVGDGAALADERRFVTRVLPRRLARLARSGPSGWPEAAAIVAGVATTGGGWAWGRLRVVEEGA